MIVGPSGGGKTSIGECLAGALTEMGTKHIIWRMNPKVGQAGPCVICTWQLHVLSVSVFASEGAKVAVY